MLDSRSVYANILPQSMSSSPCTLHGHYVDVFRSWMALRMPDFILTHEMLKTSRITLQRWSRWCLGTHCVIGNRPPLPTMLGLITHHITQSKPVTPPDFHFLLIHLNPRSISLTYPGSRESCLMTTRTAPSFRGRLRNIRAYLRLFTSCRACVFP